MGGYPCRLARYPWLMGLRDEFDEAVEAVAEIDFGQSSTPLVNMFETTIRYLGGLLAAYDLSKRDILLVKAVELGNLLYAGFDTEHRMPVDFMNIQMAKEGTGLVVEGSVVSASAWDLVDGDDALIADHRRPEVL